MYYSFLTTVKLGLVDTYRRIANMILLLFVTLLFKENKQPNRILIFRTGSLGDSICALPALSSILQTYPLSEISILTNSGGSELVPLSSIINLDDYSEVIDYSGISRFQLFKKIQVRKYDQVIQLSQAKAGLTSQIRDILFFRLAGIRSGIGWQVSTVHFFKRVQEKHLKILNERDRLSLMLEKYAFQVKRDNYSLNINADNISKAGQCILDMRPNFELVAIAPGAKRRQNRWPIEYFKDVCAYLREFYNVVLIGGDEDAVLSKSLELGNVYNYCGRLTPMESAALLQRCKYLVTNDSGPMHLSYAVSTPVVAVFSSRDFPNKWYPPDDGYNQVLRNNDVSCSMCLSDTCSNNVCMQSISPRIVIEKIIALEKLLEPSD